MHIDATMRAFFLETAATVLLLAQKISLLAAAKDQLDNFSRLQRICFGIWVGTSCHCCHIHFVSCGIILTTRSQTGTFSSHLQLQNFRGKSAKLVHVTKSCFWAGVFCLQPVAAAEEVVHLPTACNIAVFKGAVYLRFQC